jgi:hypothetical protein
LSCGLLLAFQNTHIFSKVLFVSDYLPSTSHHSLDVQVQVARAQYLNGISKHEVQLAAAAAAATR